MINALIQLPADPGHHLILCQKRFCEKDQIFIIKPARSQLASLELAVNSYTDPGKRQAELNTAFCRFCLKIKLQSVGDLILQNSTIWVMLVHLLVCHTFQAGTSRRRKQSQQAGKINRQGSIILLKPKLKSLAPARLG